MTKKEEEPMRHIVGVAKLAWKAEAITESDSVKFAEELETKLNKMAEEGFGLSMSIQRKDDMVIVGQRVEMPMGEALQVGGPVPDPEVSN
jgi:hypothetical protein